MSIEHSPVRQRQQRISALPRLAYTINEWARLTKQSRATIYRQMADGRLRYVSLGERIRRIPASESERLGLVAT
jgi:excisionase family DNA binding protein